MENKQIIQTEIPEKAGAAAAEGEKETEISRGKIIGIIVGVIVFIGLIVAAVILLANQSTDTTSHIRDIFIIFMALESILIGTALVILIVQISILINLLRNEIKPVIDSTNETVNTVRGTAVFLSNNLTEPVIKLNETLASLKKLMDLLHLGR